MDVNMLAESAVESGNMPVWLQVFYIVFSIVVLGWAIWITNLIMRHSDILAAMKERCTLRGESMDTIKDAVWRADRNIIRVGMKLGIDNELERES
jgi:hypothetical protein